MLSWSQPSTHNSRWAHPKLSTSFLSSRRTTPLTIILERFRRRRRQQRQDSYRSDSSIDPRSRCVARRYESPMGRRPARNRRRKDRWFRPDRGLQAGRYTLLVHTVSLRPTAQLVCLCTSIRVGGCVLHLTAWPKLPKPSLHGRCPSRGCHQQSNFFAWRPERGLGLRRAGGGPGSSAAEWREVVRLSLLRFYDLG